MTRLFAIASMVVALAAQTLAADWPQFRGPNDNGALDAIEHPTQWGPDKNIAWKIAIPGAGWSSPVVTGDNIFVTTAVAPTANKPKNMAAGSRDLRSMGLGAKPEDVVLKFEVHCLDLETGQTKWTALVAEQKPILPVHPSNTHATESPVTDGHNVYVYFGSIGVVACVDASGKKKWSKELGAYPVAAGLGPGASLTFGEGLLFLACDNEKQSFVVALDPESGNQVWRADSAGKTSWATPLLWRNDQCTELVCCGGKLVTSYDPKSGEVLWSLGKLDSGFSASPACDRARIFFGGSAPATAAVLYAVTAGAKGDISLAPKTTSNDWVAWSSKRNAPGMASPVVVGEELYVLTDFLNCHDVKTGERIYRQRLNGAKSFAASPWVAGDKIFMLDELGQTFVVQAGREFKLLGVNPLSESDTFWSTPAVAGRSLLIRGVDFLYCIRE